MIGFRISDELWEAIYLLHERLKNNKVVEQLYNYNVIRDEVDYLDIAAQGDELALSFLPTSRRDTVIASVGSTNEAFYSSTLRQTGKVGKILRKVLTEEVSDSDVKEFVENLQAAVNANKCELVFLTGEKMRAAYYAKNYFPSDGSELAKSCMRYARCQKYLNIYVDNPRLEAVVALRDNKVAGRALIWKDVSVCSTKGFKSTGKFKAMAPQLDGKYKDLTVLDRVYAINPKVKNQILAWGRENVDLLHLRPKDSMSFKVVKTGSDIMGAGYFEQPIEKFQYNNYPYIDTFTYLDLDRKTLNTAPYNIARGWHFSDIEGRFATLSEDSPRYRDVVEELDAEELGDGVVIENEDDEAGVLV